MWLKNGKNKERLLAGTTLVSKGKYVTIYIGILNENEFGFVILLEICRYSEKNRGKVKIWRYRWRKGTVENMDMHVKTEGFMWCQDITHGVLTRLKMIN